MTTLDQTPWPARLSTFALAALAAASIVYWGLRWAEPISAPRASSDWAGHSPIDTGRVAQLLGASTALVDDDETAPAVNQYKLIGVIAQGRGSGLGSALIATDNAPAKPYKVGDKLSDELVLQSVSARGATLAPSLRAPASLTLEVPPLAGTKP